MDKGIRGSYSRRLKAAVAQFAKDGKIKLPSGTGPSMVQHWSIQKIMEFLASQNMKPIDFGISDDIKFEPVGNALAAESAAIQLARALAEIDDLRENLKEVKEDLKTILSILASKG